jgi:hypothetical protein
VTGFGGDLHEFVEQLARRAWLSVSASGCHCTPTT